ncbi:MAG: hypothetical protein M3Q69_01970 [Acidobacteriota bacterium]|nr:hypothetical protein [Acidobacteriota bacterium]
MRVKIRGVSNLYVLIVYAPGSRTRVQSRRFARRAFAAMEPGDVVRARRRKLRVEAIGEREVRRANGTIAYVTEVFTRAVTPPNVVPMPSGEHLAMGEYLRLHALVRVFDGDADAWFAQLKHHEDLDGADLRFVRLIRTRLRQDPALIGSIRKMVEATI